MINQGIYTVSYTFLIYTYYLGRDNNFEIIYLPSLHYSKRITIKTNSMYTLPFRNNRQVYDVTRIISIIILNVSTQRIYLQWIIYLGETRGSRGDQYEETIKMLLDVCRLVLYNQQWYETFSLNRIGHGEIIVRNPFRY